MPRATFSETSDNVLSATPNLQNRSKVRTTNHKNPKHWNCACSIYVTDINPLNAELYPISQLLTLLAHPILHISRIRVK